MIASVLQSLLLLSDNCAQTSTILQQFRVEDRGSPEDSFSIACVAVLDGELDRATKLHISLERLDVRHLSINEP